MARGPGLNIFEVLEIVCYGVVNIPLVFAKVFICLSRMLVYILCLGNVRRLTSSVDFAVKLQN